MSGSPLPPSIVTVTLMSNSSLSPPLVNFTVAVPLASVAAMQGRLAMSHALGDAVAPRKVDMAIWEGHKIGREI